MNNFKLTPVPDGYKAVVHHVHDRKMIRSWLDNLDLPNKHGKYKYFSLVDIVDKATGEIVAWGYALCGRRDNPSRKLGRVIAHNRAMAQYRNEVTAVQHAA